MNGTWYIIFSNFRIPIAPNSIESILSEAIKLEFEAYSSLAKSHQNSRELNDAERAKLNELIVANKSLHEPLDDDLSTLVGDDTRFKVCSGSVKDYSYLRIILHCNGTTDCGFEIFIVFVKHGPESQEPEFVHTYLFCELSSPGL
jgi:hypothetical protein